jgi:hypothetical protein
MMNVFAEVVTILILSVPSVALYLLPGLVGWRRKLPYRGAVWVVNVTLGWTVLGWIAALVMAVWPKPKPLTDEQIRLAYIRHGQ